MKEEVLTTELLEKARKQIEVGRDTEIAAINKKYDEALASLEILSSVYKTMDKMFSEKTSSVVNSDTFAKFEKAASLKDIVLKIVTEKIQKFETANIITKLAAEETNRVLKTETDVKKFKSQVSGILSFWKSEKKISSYQFTKSKKDNVWGRLEWVGAEGKPQTDYFNMREQQDIFK